ERDADSVRDERLFCAGAQLGEPPVIAVGCEFTAFAASPQGLRRDFIIVRLLDDQPVEPFEEGELRLERETDRHHVARVTDLKVGGSRNGGAVPSPEARPPSRLSRGGGIRRRPFPPAALRPWCHGPTRAPSGSGELGW